MMEADERKEGQESNSTCRRTGNQWSFIATSLLFTVLGVGTLVAIMVGLSSPNGGAADTNQHRSDSTAISSDTQAVLGGCRKKRVRITEICNVPDLDDCGQRDTEMDIKVLLQDEVYWPRNVREDCTYGYYSGACEIPDAELMLGCYPLKNHGERIFDAPPSTGSLKITIYDEDIFSDESIDILIPNSQWYDPQDCGERTLRVSSAPMNKGANVTLLISSEEIVPTSEPTPNPTVPPTAQPSRLVTKTPTVAPTRDPTKTVCGLDSSVIGQGLVEASSEINDMQRVLSAYTDLDSNAGNDRRRLVWGALISGVSRFSKSFVGSAVTEGPLSSIADVCTIGSTIFSIFGLAGAGDDARKQQERQEELFQQVFERFDEIDRRLDGITAQIQDGFDALELAIREDSANRELDDWIVGHLSILDEDYRAYLNPDHTLETRLPYEETFRNSCQNDHSPYTTFKVLYSHTCRQCAKLDGQSNQYILDTFVDLAVANFPNNNVADRISWFRHSFGVVMIGSMIRSIYLHSVCLYQPNTVCQNDDPVWRTRLEDMGEGLEEVAASLSAAEERLKCRRKSVRITHVCNLPDLDPAIIRDDEMELELDVNSNKYWPKNIQNDCVGKGAYNGACIIPDTMLLGNGKCFEFKNSALVEYTQPQTLKVVLRDEDYGPDETIRFHVYPDDWYDSFQCDTFTIEAKATSRGNGEEDGTYIKMTIESDIIQDPWG